MEMNFFNPTQIVENNIKTGVTKANLNVIKMMIMGFFAGLFIAIGAEGSNLAIHTVSNVGLSRTLAGGSSVPGGTYAGDNNRRGVIYRQLYDHYGSCGW